jgi:hypothetical protein
MAKGEVPRPPARLRRRREGRGATRNGPLMAEDRA